jgi:cbb3-type cytochrome oxidase subunit 3
MNTIMKKMIFFFLLSVFAFSACQSGEQAPSEEGLMAEQDQLWDEVMAEHDEVMPKMSEIKRLERELTAMIGEESSLDAEAQEKVGQVVQQLSAAGEGMMSWMSQIRQLEPMREEMEHEQIIEYLKGEKEKITKVKEDMLQSIEEGTSLLALMNEE